MPDAWRAASGEEPNPTPDQVRRDRSPRLGGQDEPDGCEADESDRFSDIALNSLRGLRTPPEAPTRP